MEIGKNYENFNSQKHERLFKRKHNKPKNKVIKNR